MLPQKLALVNSFLKSVGKLLFVDRHPHFRGCLFIVSYFPKNIKSFRAALVACFAEFKAFVLLLLTEKSCVLARRRRLRGS